jgi:chloride channel 7
MLELRAAAAIVQLFDSTFRLHCLAEALLSLQVSFWAPAAAGAGVTLVMAYLNGNHIPNLLRFRTMVVKIVGCTLGVASGLAIGPEGPMVHIGACIASNITYYANARSLRFLQGCWPWARCANGEDDDDVVDSSHNVVDGNMSNTPGYERPSMHPICATCEDLQDDSEHREFISAGASAGLSVCPPTFVPPLLSALALA